MNYRVIQPPIPCTTLLALLLAPGLLSADVVAVRAAPNSHASVTAILQTEAVGDKFCNPNHCIININTPQERNRLDHLKNDGTITIETLPNARKLFLRNASYDADKGGFDRHFPGDSELSTDPNTQFILLFKSYPQRDWLDALVSAGITPIVPVPSMGYWVFGARDTIHTEVRRKPYLIEAIEIPAGLKRANLDSPSPNPNDPPAPTTLGLVSMTGGKARERLRALNGGIEPPVTNRLGPLTAYSLDMSPTDAIALSRMPEVVTVERSQPGAPSDERSNRIIAGDGLPGNTIGAWPQGISTNTLVNGAGMWDRFLAGLPATIPNAAAGAFDLSNQVIGFYDTGVSTGLANPPIPNPHPDCAVNICPDHLTAPNGACRLAYTNDITTDFTAPERRCSDYLYHGSLTTSIAAGFATAPANGRDSAGWSFTQGVAQGARIAMVKALPILPGGASCVSYQTRIPSLLEGAFRPGQFAKNLRYALVSTTTTVTPVPDGSPAGLDVRTFNHSWNETMTEYNDTAQYMDQASNSLASIMFTFDTGPVYGRQAPALQVVSAGNCNDGSVACGAGDHLIWSPATAKNVLAVGATYTDNHESYPAPFPVQAPYVGCATNAPLDVGSDYRTIPAFSRLGWDSSACAYVACTRVKPDLVAPGVRAYGRRSQSSLFCGSDCNSSLGGGNAYMWGWGTSFAAPVVTGAATLVREWLQALNRGNPAEGSPDPTPALIRAALIGTATDLCPGDNCDLPFFPGLKMRSAPDRFQGWGAVALDKLFKPPTHYSILEGGVDAFYAITKRVYVDDPAHAVSITLVWDDTPTMGGAMDPEVVLINDLNLEAHLTTNNGPSRTYYGNHFGRRDNELLRDGHSVPNPPMPIRDHANNVEKISVRFDELPAAGGPIDITIIPFYVGGGPCVPYPGCNSAEQSFALFVENAHD